MTKHTILGAIAGDVFGSIYEFNNIKTVDFKLCKSSNKSELFRLKSQRVIIVNFLSKSMDCFEKRSIECTDESLNFMFRLFL